MKTKVILGLALVMVLFIGISAIASNMGFKINLSISAGVPKYVALPYYNSYSNASDVQADIVAAGGDNVTLYKWTGTLWQKWYAAGAGNVDFAITAGDGIQVTSTQPVASWVVVGSHNPGQTIDISSGVPKYFAVPYHTTATTASDLQAELVAEGGANVTLYKWTGTLWQKWYAAGAGNVDFTISAGDAIQVSSTSPVSGWVPAHY